MSGGINSKKSTPGEGQGGGQVDQSRDLDPEFKSHVKLKGNVDLF